MSTDDLQQRFATTLHRERVVAILRTGSAAEAVSAGRRLVDQGVRVLEVSLNTPDAVSAIATLATAFGDDAFVGAGTVLRAEDVHRVADAGARFFVSPVLDRTAIAAAHERALLAIPGCATPTEMRDAHELGAFAVKVFPATLWTASGLANVLRAMPFLRAIPTGGLKVADATTWLAAGATALGLGSALTDSPDAVRLVQEQIGAFASSAASR
jgi:2-dehydro-3-deoxyphosphogluconate aldolase/(4S)-4-hydroxy-2-oxoglutarate aldolase